MRETKTKTVQKYAITAREAAAFLGLSIRTVQYYARRGLIPHRRVGKKYLFSELVLRDWLDNRENVENERLG